MKPEPLFGELEEIANRLGYTVVLDRGNFTGGGCIVEGESMIVLNKSAPIEQRLRLLAQAVILHELKDIFIKPAVRAYLDNYDESETNELSSKYD